MNGQHKLLSRQLLNELELRWRERDAPILNRLNPGLADAEIDALTQPIAVELPAEARLWWGWHDGVDMTQGSFAYEREVGPWWRILSLAEAVAEYQRCRTISEDVERAARRPEPAWWHPSWFPIAHDPGVAILACDCAVGPGDPTPIRRLTQPEGLPAPEPRVPSLGTLIACWIEAFDRGVWARRTGGGWTIDESRWPPEWPRNGVV